MKKPYIVIIPLLVTSAILSGCNITPQNANTNSNTQSFVLKPSNEPSTKPSAKIFNNNKYDFSFAYPTKLHVVESNNSTSDIVELKDENQVPLITLLITPISNKIPSTNMQKLKVLTFNAVNWTEYYTNKIDGGPDPSLNAEEYQLRYENKSNQFILRFYGQNQMNPIQTQIVESFKFNK